MAFAAAVLVMLLVVPLRIANAQTIVDWILGKDYSSYTTQSFKPGGTIVFNYDNTMHNVEIVSKSDYDNCNSGNALQTFTDGKTSVPLKQGPMYFICGIPGHCAAGMKLQVNAAGDSGSSAAPVGAPSTTPATLATPESAPASVFSASLSPFSAPSPKDGVSGAAALSSAGHFMLGVTVVLGAFFAVVA